MRADSDRLGAAETETHPLLLLTAAVTPNVQSPTAVSSPTQRLAQYHGVLKRVLDTLPRGSGVIVVETTGMPRSTFLQGMDEALAARVDYQNYEPSPDELSRGKGAVELRAIDDALSRAIPNLRDDLTLYKLTGRLFVRNLTKLMAPVPSMTLAARGTLDRSWVDTRLLGARISFWKDMLCAAAPLCDDSRGIYVERAIPAHLARRIVLGDVRVQRFPQRPQFSGVSGSTGRVYGTSAIRSGVETIIGAPLESAMARLSSMKQV